MKFDKEASIFIADHHGLVGDAIRNKLEREGFKNIFTSGAVVPSLTDAHEVDGFFESLAPQYVFLVGGRTGGINANQKFPADLMLDNLLVDCHVMGSARHYGVKQLLYLASSCAYPKSCPQPMRVESLMTGKLEPTNAAYATAKLAGLTLCQAMRQQFGLNYVAAIPANIFGPGDDFSEEDSHVVGALFRRMHEAKTSGRSEVIIWGSGLPRREFIYAQDLADACLFIMDRYHDSEPINIGVGRDWSIRELAENIKETVGYAGRLQFDTSKPDGMPAKLLDSNRLQEMGWTANFSLRDGLVETYQWYLDHLELAAGGGDVRALL